MSTRIELRGLPGTNPLGFFAALGLLALLDRQLPDGSRMSWTDDVVPYPCMHGLRTVDEVVELAMRERDLWLDATALSYEIDGGPINDVKLSPAATRDYLAACRAAKDGGRSAALAAALVAEGSFFDKGRERLSKPTDLHFAAGQQSFVKMCRELVRDLERNDVEEALVGPWRYERTLPSLKWDITDDRLYAISASNPASAMKQTVPGAEYLALLGLSWLPVFAHRDRTATTGCSGSWMNGWFTWPLWTEPLAGSAVRTLLAHASVKNAHWLRAWGVQRLISSRIRRSAQGYGSFSPPSGVWEAGDDGR